MEPLTVPTLCRMCDHGCGMEVTVADGRPVAVRGNRKHPFNKGWLCAKGRRALDLFNAPNRLTSPLIRSKGRLVPATWEEALDTAAERLLSIRERHGAEGLAVYHGEGVGHQEIKAYMKRFANVYGTPNFMGVGSLCNAARTLAEVLTFGGLTKPDIPHTRFLMVWGANPMVSHEPYPPRELGRLRKRGAQLVVIDPRRTETAAQADLHLPVRPGRDEVLVLNMLHVLVRDRLWDEPFVNRWVPEWNRFARIAAEERFSPEAGEAATGLAPDLVRRAARAYAAAKPAGVLTGNGLEHHPRGVHTMRLVALLKAATGNLDIRGGDLFTPRPKMSDITSPLPVPEASPVGSDRFPLLCRARKEAHALALPQAVLEGNPYPVKGLIVAGGNVTMEWPDSGRIRQTLRNLDVFLVIDVVDSPDCRYAHVVLPACTFLERDEHRVNVYQNLPYITLRQRVVEPVFGLPDQMIWVKLAERMGMGSYFPWKSCEEGIDDLLEEAGVTYRELVSRGGMFSYDETRYRKFETAGFATPTGRVQIDPDRLGETSSAPAFALYEAGGVAGSQAAFPLLLTTGGNLLPYTHWQFRHIPKLRRMSPSPFFDIHPDTASSCGLSDGDPAEIETAFGRIRLAARLTQRILPGTIHVPQGWEEANANELTGLQELDPVSGFPNLKSLGCRIRRLQPTCPPMT